MIISPGFIRHASVLALLGILLSLGVFACNRASLVETMAPAGDEAAAKDDIDLLRAGRFDEIEKKLDPSIKNADIHASLVKMKGLVPEGAPLSSKLVGINVFNGPAGSRTDLTFEYEFPSGWILMHVALHKKLGVSTIAQFNVTPIPRSLEDLHKFTLAGKSALQYVVLALAFLVPLFSLGVLVLCVRTKMEKKWLWAILILLCQGKFSVDWTTGKANLQMLSIQLVGGSAMAPPFGAWVVSVSLPVGAIAYLVWRQRQKTQVASAPTPVLKP